MRLAWITDPHLDFLGTEEIVAFCRRVRGLAPDAVVITGDIANARSVRPVLTLLDAHLAVPVYFVLGNHDYYGGSVPAVRAAVAAQQGRARRLVYLTHGTHCALTGETGLVGHDGWADGRYGDWRRSTVELNDYRLIAELQEPATRLAAMQRLAAEAAAHFRAVLPAALARHRRVIVATHVPPFREACWHEGRISDDNGLPHFSSKAVGEALLDVMRDHEDRRLLVLCGHTHSAGTATIRHNLTVLAGAAEYGRPAVQRLFEVA